MFETWKHIEKNGFYNRLLLQAYKNLVKRRMPIDPPGTWNEHQLKKIKTKYQWVWTYRHHFGYPNKFLTMEEYNKKIDVYPLLSKIRVPTLIINAFDDPISSF